MMMASTLLEPSHRPDNPPGTPTMAELLTSFLGGGNTGQWVNSFVWSHAALKQWSQQMFSSLSQFKDSGYQ